LSREAEDTGRIFENIVFIELFRREGEIENKNIFYYKSKKDQECDFVIAKRGKVERAIQVTYSLDEKNREREINGILAALEFYDLKDGLILTRDQEDELKINDKKIVIMPIWKWLLK
jgi:predicted AAA+ superfamily ATPase